MLVITRKVGETLEIGDDIKITVSLIKNKQVRLAINAPQETQVWRAEYNDKKRKYILRNKK